MLRAIVPSPQAIAFHSPMREFLLLPFLSFLAIFFFPSLLSLFFCFVFIWIIPLATGEWERKAYIFNPCNTTVLIGVGRCSNSKLGGGGRPTYPPPPPPPHHFLHLWCCTEVVCHEAYLNLDCFRCCAGTGGHVHSFHQSEHGPLPVFHSLLATKSEAETLHCC